jgi:uncharacterized protein (DUF2267 family)
MEKRDGRSTVDELIRMVSERAGIGEDAARTAVQTVIGFIKDRLPEPISGQIENALGGAGADAGDTLKNLGGMLGRR